MHRLVTKIYPQGYCILLMCLCGWSSMILVQPLSLLESPSYCCYEVFRTHVNPKASRRSQNKFEGPPMLGQYIPYYNMVASFFLLYTLTKLPLSRIQPLYYPNLSPEIRQKRWNPNQLETNKFSAASINPGRGTQPQL